MFRVRFYCSSCIPDCELFMFPKTLFGLPLLVRFSGSITGYLLTDTLTCQIPPLLPGPYVVAIMPNCDSTYAIWHRKSSSSAVIMFSRNTWSSTACTMSGPLVPSRLDPSGTVCPLVEATNVNATKIPVHEVHDQWQMVHDQWKCSLKSWWWKQEIVSCKKHVHVHDKMKYGLWLKRKKNSSL